MKPLIVPVSTATLGPACSLEAARGSDGAREVAVSQRRNATGDVLIFKIRFFLFCMYECLHICKYTTWMQCLQMSSKSVRSPRVKNGCELPFGS